MNPCSSSFSSSSCSSSSSSLSFCVSSSSLSSFFVVLNSRRSRRRREEAASPSQMQFCKQKKREDGYVNKQIKEGDVRTLANLAILVGGEHLYGWVRKFFLSACPGVHRKMSVALPPFLPPYVCTHYSRYEHEMLECVVVSSCFTAKFYCNVPDTVVLHRHPAFFLLLLLLLLFLLFLLPFEKERESGKKGEQSHCLSLSLPLSLQSSGLPSFLLSLSYPSCFLLFILLSLFLFLSVRSGKRKERGGAMNYSAALFVCLSLSLSPFFSGKRALGQFLGLRAQPGATSDSSSASVWDHPIFAK